jgi:hypothetical protein
MIHPYGQKGTIKKALGGLLFNKHYCTVWDKGDKAQPPEEIKLIGKCGKTSRYNASKGCNSFFIYNFTKQIFFFHTVILSNYTVKGNMFYIL